MHVPEGVVGHAEGDGRPAPLDELGERRDQRDEALEVLDHFEAGDDRAVIAGDVLPHVCEAVRRGEVRDERDGVRHAELAPSGGDRLGVAVHEHDAASRPAPGQRGGGADPVAASEVAPQRRLGDQ